MAPLERMSGRIAILLSTFAGERYLNDQLQSLLAQTHRDWVLYWRDDGSSDRTVTMMEAFARGPAAGRVVPVPGPEARLGAQASFFHLLAAALDADPDAEALAYADQDDVWLPEKLARGRLALAGAPAGLPALYCARQILVDEHLRRIGLSVPVCRAPGFPGALTQNIATGCTVMLNPPAAALIAASRAPAETIHDWWSYLMVAAAGGRVLAYDTPTVLYRQHAGNLVGAPSSWPRRAVAALRRGPGAFMGVFRRNVAALEAHAHLLSPEARADLHAIQRALSGGRLSRAAILGMPGLRRQTWHETMLFRWWFLIG